MREDVLRFRSGDDEGSFDQERLARVEDESESLLVRVIHSSEVAT